MTQQRHPFKYFIILLLAIFITSNYTLSENVYVQVRQAKLKSNPNPWSSTLATLAYGDSIQKIGGNDSWWQVKTAKNLSGYIAATSVTERKVILSSKGFIDQGSHDSSDVVMAGKGFSKQLEDSYARNNQLNYRSVNNMDSLRFSESELKSFAKQGQLKGIN